jgi:uncharacterized protein with HEPN domain
MDTRAAKELLHIDAWLERVDEIVARGRRSYLDDDLLQEAGDSLMMKLGEAAGRLSRLNVLAPDGVEWALAVANRNFIIHQYDEVNRETTWLTLSRDLPEWRSSLQSLFSEALAAITAAHD